MNVPLYRCGLGRNWNGLTALPAANLGLVFDKFFDGWNGAFDEYASKEAKSLWVKRIAGARPAPLLADAIKRQQALVTKLGGAVWYAVAVSRFVTGTGIANPLENGFAFHHTLGVPYLTASGLKGGARNYWTEWHDPKPNDRDEIDRLLGSAKGGVGSIILFDMLPIAPVALVPEVMTPHYADWYQNGEAPGDWMSPTPIPFIAVEAGAVFQIAAAPRVFGDPNWTATNRDRLKEILENALDITGLGAKTSVGYGRFPLFDTAADAKAAADVIVAALRAEWTPPPAGHRSDAPPVTSPTYKSGDTLPAGTTVNWNADGDVFEVKTRAAVTLAPKMKVPVAYEGLDDEAPISQIVELKHIN